MNTTRLKPCSGEESSRAALSGIAALRRHTMQTADDTDDGNGDIVRPMRPFRILLPAILGAVVLMSGCATGNRQAAVERELRLKEDQIRELTARLEQAERELQDQDRRLAALRSDPATRDAGMQLISATTSVTEEALTAWGSVSAVHIHPRLTGIVSDGNSEPVISVILQPTDDQGEVIKVPAAITVRVSQVGDRSAPEAMVEKSFSLTESRRLWSRGLLAKGFHVELPLDQNQVAALKQDNSARLLIQASIELGPQRRYSDTLTVPATLPETTDTAPRQSPAEVSPQPGT